ncbi:zinc finger and SCAN domain-containing protein 31-like isoform X2 [Rhineura floridana]|uniref:zinc finger and SCAN domain-containing protein 31-like isoform X2 n=1 Tax=Rhineura floridana TaxID=261503 RepID=UPI002AC83D0B|nr:zinc finger and SCAN domain-containing protein 31-like isoform X2 [Rhineura floridana]
MAAEQGIVGDPVPQFQAGLQPGEQMVERGLLSPKPEEESEEGSETLSNIPAGSPGGFPKGMTAPQIKEEAKEGLAPQWEPQWRHFPKEPQAFHTIWGNPHLPQPSPWGHTEALPPPLQGGVNVSRRPGGEWAAQLLSGLSRDIQGTLAKDETGCGEVKEKVSSDEETVGMELRRQQFRQFCFQEAEGPREVCSRLWFLCYQWLKPERRTKEQILELLILEQFLAVLPPEVQRWVKERSPETCAQAVALAEDYLLRQEEPLRTDGELSEPLGAEERSFGALLPLQHMEKVVSGLLAEVGLYSSKAKGTFRKRKQERGRDVSLPDNVQEMEVGAVLPQETPKKEEPPQDCGRDLDTGLDVAGCEDAPPGLKPHKCSECGKRFHQISHLNRHLRIHTGEKPYKCLDCGKSFTQGSCLLGHQRIHTGEKAYSCSYCDKSFIWSSGLHQHEKIHLGEKPYKCLECGKSFHRSSALTDHVRSHTGEKPYTCSDCGKGFSQHSNLIVHRRVHTGEKPYTCSVCGKSFTRTALLMAHRRIHTGEKPYKCLICERSFRERPALTKHKKIHMRENL